MARPGLSQNRKFRRLVRDLGSTIIARGVLELIWDACYESGNDYLGSDDDVELAAFWDGDPGKLVKALASAGGEGKAGFIEPDPDSPGWRVHDLFENAPDYVQKRMMREIARNERGETISTLRREAGKKGRLAQLAGNHPANGGQKEDSCPDLGTSGGQMSDICPEKRASVGQAAANGATPAPAPAPAPAPNTPKEPSLRSGSSPAPQDVLDLWQRVAVPAGLIPVLQVSKTLLKALGGCLAVPGWFELFQEALVYAAKHPEGAWMRGHGTGKWTADLGYFLKPDAAAKTAARGRAARASPTASRTSAADEALKQQLSRMPIETLSSAVGAP